MITPYLCIHLACSMYVWDMYVEACNVCMRYVYGWVYNAMLYICMRYIYRWMPCNVYMRYIYCECMLMHAIYVWDIYIDGWHAMYVWDIYIVNVCWHAMYVWDIYVAKWLMCKVRP